MYITVFLARGNKMDSRKKKFFFFIKFREKKIRYELMARKR